MISAMPAVAIRRERSKSQDRIKGPGMLHFPRRRGRLALIEYYHRKISRMGSVRPPHHGRAYSTATSPDTEMPPEILMADPELAARFPWLSRVFRYISLFHLGCCILGAGLVILFVSVSSIKADVTQLRAVGSSLIVLGAVICFVRTVFFTPLDPDASQIQPTNLLNTPNVECQSVVLVRFRSNESLHEPNNNPASPTSASTVEQVNETASSPKPNNNNNDNDNDNGKDFDDVFRCQRKRSLNKAFASKDNFKERGRPRERIHLPAVKPTSLAIPADGTDTSSSGDVSPQQRQSSSAEGKGLLSPS